VYHFTRENADCFDGCEAVDVTDGKVESAANVLVTVRKRGESNQVVLHVLDRDYDSETKSMRFLLNVEVSVDKSLVSPRKSRAWLLSYDKPPQSVDLVEDANTVRIRMP